MAGYSTESVVQETFMHILSLLGNGPYFDNVVKSGAYSASGLFTDVSRPFIEMHGKRIGIIGMGTIGSRVAKVAESFGMEVVYYSTSGTGHCKEYPSISLKVLMKTSDVISIHAPYNERTAGLIGLKELEWMKPSAIIVNMGRGGIVDEQALATVIDKNLIGGAALDVFTSEPLPADSPLLHLASGKIPLHATYGLGKRRSTSAPDRSCRGKHIQRLVIYTRQYKYFLWFAEKSSCPSISLDAHIHEMIEQEICLGVE